jgi:hypothetical protein
MTAPREPTLKQWKRRALKAERQVEFLQGVRAIEAETEFDRYRELATLRVAAKEALDALHWAIEDQK